jgi:hypothetical protein
VKGRIFQYTVLNTSTSLSTGTKIFSTGGQNSYNILHHISNSVAEPEPTELQHFSRAGSAKNFVAFPALGK